MLLSLVLALVLQETEPQRAPPRFVSAEYGFIITAPEGFLFEGSDPLREMRDLVCFVKLSNAATDPPEPWVRLCVERAGSDLPDNARRETFSWKGQELEGGRFTAPWGRLNGAQVDIVGVKIPLAKETVSMVAMTEAGKSDHAKAAVVRGLMTFEADERGARQARDQRFEKLGENIGLAAGIVMAIGVGMWIANRRKASGSS